MTFQQKLCALRKQCDLTQKQIADTLNLDRSAYSYYETGKSNPPMDKMITLARIFNVSLDELMCVEDRLAAVKDGTSIYNTPHAILNPVATLPKEEQDLILLYRSMSAPMCDDVIQYMRGLLSKAEA